MVSSLNYETSVGTIMAPNLKQTIWIPICRPRTMVGDLDSHFSISDNVTKFICHISFYFLLAQ